MQNTSSYLKETTNITAITYSIKIFTILDIIATLFIGLFSLFAPDLHVTFFKREPTIVILLVIVIIMVVLSARPLARKIGSIIFRFIFGLFLTLFILYTTYLFLQWYLYNIEGTFTYRFLSFTKKASFDSKLDFYNTISYQMIEIIKAKNVDLAIYLEKSPLILNPSTAKLMHTPYHLIPELAEQCILSETENYLRIMKNISVGTDKSNTGHYLKVAAICVGIVASIAVIGYLIYYITGSSGNSVLKDTMEKGLVNLSNTQYQIDRLGLQSQIDSLNAKTDSLDLSALGKIVGKSLTKINNHTESIDHIKHIINKVIRPCTSMLYQGLKAENPGVAAAILSTISEEQQDFITATSKLVFK